MTETLVNAGSQSMVPRRSRALLGAALLAAFYTIAVLVVGLMCRDFLTRLDNLAGLTASAICAAALAAAALRGDDRSRTFAQLPAGIVSGLFLQPSIAGLIALAVLFVGTRNALSVSSRPAAFALLGLGLILGVALDFGLMALITPSQLRC